MKKEKRSPETGSGKRSRYRKPAIAVILFGIALILGAGALFGYNLWDNSRAERESAQILEALEKQMPAEDRYPSGDGEPDFRVETVDGYEYIGVLAIPSENLKLPVMAEWDYTRLTISPCRYAGSYKTDDMVICAHNYASHFGSIQSIGLGVELKFKAIDGSVYSYKVANREVLEPTAVEDMVQNRNNSDRKAEDWDLTLFTCNTSGMARCALRCIRTN